MLDGGRGKAIWSAYRDLLGVVGLATLAQVGLQVFGAKLDCLYVHMH